MPKNRALSYRSAALYLAGLINPYRKWYFIASGLAFVSAGTGLLNAKITQRLIDSSKGGAASSVILNAVLFAAIIAVNYFVARLGGAAVSRLAAGAVCDMKRAVAASLLRADYSAVIGLKAGDALSTANSDTQIITAFLSGDLTGLFSQLVMALGTAVCLLCIDPLLTAVTFAYTPLGLFFTLTLNRKMQRLYPVRADRTGEALSVIEQALAQIPVIKSFVLEKRMRDRVRAGCDSILETDMKTAVHDALLQPACASTSSMPRILFFSVRGHAGPAREYDARRLHRRFRPAQLYHRAQRVLPFHTQHSEQGSGLNEPCQSAYRASFLK